MCPARFFFILHGNWLFNHLGCSSSIDFTAEATAVAEQQRSFRAQHNCISPQKCASSITHPSHADMFALCSFIVGDIFMIFAFVRFSNRCPSRYPTTIFFSSLDCFVIWLHVKCAFSWLFLSFCVSSDKCVCCILSVLFGRFLMLRLTFPLDAYKFSMNSGFQFDLFENAVPFRF